jgi:hypothetical protein
MRALIADDGIFQVCHAGTQHKNFGPVVSTRGPVPCTAGERSEFRPVSSADGDLLGLAIHSLPRSIAFQ